MPQNELSSSWQPVRSDLDRALSELQTATDCDNLLPQVQEFLEHNELGSACEVLADYGEHHPQTAEFWFALKDAALKMGLTDNAEIYKRLAGAS